MLYSRRSNFKTLKDYLFEKEGPLFCFGHGLSYTTFKYGDVVLEKDRISLAESTKVSVSVSNVGKRAGDEIVQMYIRDRVASVIEAGSFDIMVGSSSESFETVQLIVE